MSDNSSDKQAAAVLSDFNRAITGVEGSWPAAQTTILLQQVAYTPATLVTKLQEEAAPLQAVVDARSTLVSALTNRRTAMPGAVQFIEGFFASLPQYLPPGADVSKFGAKPKKARTPLTAEQKVAANTKRTATRAARHIMGKKQRAAIHATPPTTPTTPAATPPATPTTPATP